MPAFRRPPRALLWLALLCCLPRGFAQEHRALRVAAVQFSIGAQDLTSGSAYRAHVTRLVERCLLFEPDLILFPEYTAAFLALLPYGALIRDAASVEEAFRRVRARESLAGSPRELLLLNSGLAERAAEELFGGLARRHGVAVGAGTYFASNGEGRLVNRAVVFGPDGQLLHVQDKVFLTPYEEEVLGLEPGRLTGAAPFLLGGWRIGLTICRDTFFPEWEQRLGRVALWVDLQGNGEAFTTEVRERFQEALPARLVGGGVPYGLTVCLTGGLMGLGWEGESFLATRDPVSGQVRVVRRAASPTGEEILHLVLPAPR